MSISPKVSFVICTYNRADYLRDALESLLQYDYSDRDFELLVVDNNSTDATHEVVEELQKAHGREEYEINYVKETRQGLSHARNRGIRESRAPAVVYLDDDITATESLIPAWISFFAKHDKPVAGGGKIHVQFDAPRPDWMSHFLLPLLGYHDLGNSVRKYPGNKYPFGGNMGFKKSVFEDTGFFRTDLGRIGKELNAGEEKELFGRLRSFSVPIYYLPDAYLFHRVDASRLTIDYIRKQAFGLGKSMKYRMQHASQLSKLQNLISELLKFTVSMPLALGYMLIFQASKARLVLRFRWWIWKGYTSATPGNDR